MSVCICDRQGPLAVLVVGSLRLQRQRGVPRGTRINQLDRMHTLSFAPILEEDQSCLRKRPVSLRKGGLSNLQLHRALQLDWDMHHRGWHIRIVLSTLSTTADPDFQLLFHLLVPLPFSI